MLRASVNSSLKRQLLTQTFQIRTLSTSSPKKQESTPPTPSTPSEILTWTDFFQLRKQKRTINLVSSATTALVTSSLSWQYISNIEIDPTQMIFGFDPFMIFFAGFLTTGAFGFLLGPILGNVVFRLKNAKSLEQFKAKDKEFLEKIVKNRVDPSSQSFSNPVPDYYGEKIQSLKSYRNWLRDGNAYKRKAREFL